MRDRISTALEILGFATVSIGLFLIVPALGVVAAGGSLIFIGASLGRN